MVLRLVARHSNRLRTAFDPTLAIRISATGAYDWIRTPEKAATEVHEAVKMYVKAATRFTTCQRQGYCYAILQAFCYRITVSKEYE